MCCRRKAKRNATLLPLKEGAKSQGMQTSVYAVKGKKKFSPKASRKRYSLADTLILAQ